MDIFTHSRYQSLIFGLIWCHRANLQLHLIWIVSACSLIFWTILNPGILRFADLIFQKCSRTLSFFKHFQVETELSLQSRAHFSNLIFQKWSVFLSDSQVEIEVSLSVSCAFCRSHLPKVFPTVFLHSQVEIKYLLQSRAHFANLICRPHLPKVFGTPQFLNIFRWKSRPRYSPVHFLSAAFPDRAQPQKQRPSFGDRGSHLTWKNTGFCARECFQAWIWIHVFLIFYTSQRLDDDAVAIMMCLTWWWLTWWCGCHDGG